MKRLVSTITALMLTIVMCTNIVSAEEMRNNNDNGLSFDAFIKEATCKVEKSSSGQDVIILKKTKQLSSSGDIKSYVDVTTYAVSDSQEQTMRVLDKIEACKQENTVRGSGSYTDEDLFHGMSLRISSTVYYSTAVVSGITYGGITSVYVNCSVNNSTIIDGLSLQIHQEGFPQGKGMPVEYDINCVISNRSTTNAPSNWEKVYWSGSVGSLVGAKVTAVVHRGTSSQYTYAFVNNIIE